MTSSTRFLTALLTTLLFAGTAAARQDTLTLSRARCVEIALSENPTIKVADMEVKRMVYARRETTGSLYPSIDFQGAYQRAIELQTVSMNMGGQSQQFKMGTDNVWSFGFNAAMPLMNASIWKAIQISDTQIMASLEEARGSRLDMVNNVNKAYYSWLLAIASRDVVRANYDVALTNADIFRKQFDAGTASEYDVLRTSVAVKNLEPELLQADIAIRQCALQLKVLMGMDDSVEIRPDVTLRDMQREMYGYSLGASGTSLENNTTMRTLAIQDKLLRQNVTLKKFAWIPSLAASYNMNWNAMSSGNAFRNQQFNPYSTVSLALQVPVFNGLGRLNAVKQAEIQYKELQLNRENVESSLRMQVNIA